MDYTEINAIDKEARRQMDECGAVYTNDMIDCIVRLAMKSVEYQAGFSINSCVDKILTNVGFKQSASQVAV